MKNCKECKKQFEIDSNDKTFYKKVNVPEPKLCPQCRMQRRFAFRNEKELLGRVKAISEGRTHADMIQDLNDLCVLGKENSGLLAKINYDMSILDQAAQMADEMADLLATATGEKAFSGETKMIRDRAHTHVKEAVDEIYAFGQYIFRGNDKRLKGYSSHYLRRVRAKRTLKKNES